MFNDIRQLREFVELKFLGAQEYNDTFKERFGHSITKQIRPEHAYNPEDDSTIPTIAPPPPKSS